MDIFIFYYNYISILILLIASFFLLLRYIEFFMYRLNLMGMSLFYIKNKIK